MLEKETLVTIGDGIAVAAGPLSIAIVIAVFIICNRKR